MFRQVWIGGKKSTGYRNLNKFQNLKLLKKNDVFLYFCREIGSNLDTRSPIDFGSALDIWVSASSSWTLDGFSFQFLNFEFSFWFLGVEYIGSAFGSWFSFRFLISAISFWTFDIGFDFQFLDVCYWFRLLVLGRLLLVSAFGSWRFFRFRLSVLGHLIYRFWLFVLGCLIYRFRPSVMAATSHWALDRFRLQYLLKLWVSAVISLGIEMFQLQYLWIWKSAPESQ
ncbi:unnamed protein product [Rhizophagus irregularis]|nr:unnamed protein product [Rhizophagus irregularis]